MATVVGGQDAPIALDLQFIKGEDFLLELDWQDDTGAAMPAAGTTMLLFFESSALGGSFPTAAGHLALNDGRVVIAYSAAETALFDFVSTRWWIDKIDSSNRRIRWMQGRARLEG